MIRLVAVSDGRRHAWRTQSLAPGRLASWLSRVVERRLPAIQAQFSAAVAALEVDHWLRELAPDVINVHNMHGAGWPLGLLEICARHAPVVATLHDMWTFTGHCIYSYDCTRFCLACDRTCPIPEDYPALAPSRIGDAWRHRRDVLLRIPPHRLVAVSPSHWLAYEASRGLWAQHRVEVIPNGIPLELFRPLSSNDRRSVRRSLGLPDRGVVGLVAAALLSERRKGWNYLCAASSSMESGRLSTIAAVGAASDRVPLSGIPLVPLGLVTRDSELARIYCAADLLLHPAPVDNLPNVVIEAMACGTPTVAFAVGGLPELVRPGLTGWLANGVSGLELAQVIGRATSALDSGMNLRERCREVAVAEFGDGLQATRYERLFRELTEAR